MKKPLLCLCLAGISLISAAQQFSLLKDINPGPASSNVCYLTNAGNYLFFAASNGINGMELWKTDGTESGTAMIKDIKPGSASSSIGYLTRVNHTLFFVANNGPAGTELWKSDGTSDGTVMVSDIRPGSMGSNPSSLAALNGVLYFAADDGLNGVELWKSDGTAAGTTLVKDINPLSAGSNPQFLTNANGVLYFAANNGSKGVELWKSDGTATGTVLLKDISPGATSGFPSSLVAVGNTLFFAATDGIKGTELWKSDGTTGGTILLEDIWPGPGDSYPFCMKNIDGQLFFAADNGTKGNELWKSDGTTAGTLLIKDVWPGIESGSAGNYSQLLNKLIFTGNDGVSGYTTWESDGSAEGTKVATIGTSGNMSELAETDNNIFASILESNAGRELWAANYSAVLPLQMFEFTGWLSDNDALLSWKTGNELNTDQFLIERNTNGSSNYKVVGSVKSANTSGIHSYVFRDAGISSFDTGVIHYRLKQTDQDGRFSYSKVVSLTIKAKYKAVLFPNPAATRVDINITAKHNEKLQCRVFDNGGRLVIQQSILLTNGTNGFDIDITRLSSGVFYLTLQSNTINEQWQFVKQ